jgi:hypothetical protein
MHVQLFSPGSLEQPQARFANFIFLGDFIGFSPLVFQHAESSLVKHQADLLSKLSGSCIRSFAFFQIFNKTSARFIDTTDYTSIKISCSHFWHPRPHGSTLGRGRRRSTDDGLAARSLPLGLSASRDATSFFFQVTFRDHSVALGCSSFAS